jgi:hypothetical protein
MMDTRRNLHQFLKGQQLYSALYDVYTEVLHDLTAVLKESDAKGETVKTTIIAPPSIKEFHEQRSRKRKPTNNADKGAKKPTISTTGINDPQLQSKSEVPARNFFAPLRSIDMEADHGHNMDDSTERQQHEASSSHADRPPLIVISYQVNLIQLHRQLKGLLKGNFEFCNTRNRTRVVMKEMADFSAKCSHFDSNNLPSIPNTRSL